MTFHILLIFLNLSQWVFPLCQRRFVSINFGTALYTVQTCCTEDTNDKKLKVQIHVSPANCLKNHHASKNGKCVSHASEFEIGSSETPPQRCERTAVRGQNDDQMFAAQKDSGFQPGCMVAWWSGLELLRCGFFPCNLFNLNRRDLRSVWHQTRDCPADRVVGDSEGTFHFAFAGRTQTVGWCETNSSRLVQQIHSFYFSALSFMFACLKSLLGVILFLSSSD